MKSNAQLIREAYPIYRQADRFVHNHFKGYHRKIREQYTSESF